VSRKRRYDLREFWPWYERSSEIGDGGHATPPPFSLSDIARKGSVPTRETPYVVWLIGAGAAVAVEGAVPFV
jgi:hypothetical protein